MKKGQQEKTPLLLAIFEKFLGKKSKKPTEKEQKLINAEKKIKKSIHLLGINEWNFFIKFFDVAQKPLDIVKKVCILQKSIGFPEQDCDGIIGAITLQRLYEHYYIKYQDTLGDEQKNRWKVYEDLKGYSEISQVLFEVSVFSSTVYYGGVNKRNALMNLPFPNTYINKKIFPHIEEKGEPNTIHIEINSGKYILRMYNADGNIYVLTYVSPGKKKPGMQSPENEIFRFSGKQDMYYRDSREGSKPFAIELDDEINWISGTSMIADGDDRGNRNFRVPLHYMSEIYRYAQNNKGIKIFIGDLY